MIADELHLMGESSAKYEIVLSRMRYMASALKQEDKESMRIIALSSPIANYKVVAEWLDCSARYNFAPSSRPVPLDLFVKSYDHNEPEVRFN